MTQRHVLQGPHGWTLTYISHSEKGVVTLQSEKEGQGVRDCEMNVVRARRHYQNMLEQGFVAVDSSPRCDVCGDPVGEGQATADCCLCLRHCLIASMG